MAEPTTPPNTNDVGAPAYSTFIDTILRAVFPIYGAIAPVVDAATGESTTVVDAAKEEYTKLKETINTERKKAGATLIDVSAIVGGVVVVLAGLYLAVQETELSKGLSKL